MGWAQYILHPRLDGGEEQVMRTGLILPFDGTIADRRTVNNIPWDFRTRRLTTEVGCGAVEEAG
jgi:hypothetical protein